MKKPKEVSGLMSVKELVTIGRIVGAHGIKGEFRLLPLTDFPDRFNGMDHLDVYRPNGSFWCRLTINSLREHVGKSSLLSVSTKLSTERGLKACVAAL